MNEVNELWKRNNTMARVLTAYGTVLSVLLWSASYYASYLAATQGQGIWFAFVSGATLLSAMGATIGVVIGIGIVLTDEPPLEGSNR